MFAERRKMPDAGFKPRLPPDDFVATPRSRVRRHPERAHYDRATVYAILDAALLCHIGYVVDGKPYVTPTLFWRDGDRVFCHGSSKSRMLRAQRAGIPVCVAVSHLDGLVAARSAFRHSMNYRSVMLFGSAAAVTDDAAKEAGLNAFIERLYPGRTARMRAILPQEKQDAALDLLRRAGARLISLTPVRTSLEDYFLAQLGKNTDRPMEGAKEGSAQLTTVGRP